MMNQKNRNPAMMGFLFFWLLREGQQMDKARRLRMDFSSRNYPILHHRARHRSHHHRNVNHSGTLHIQNRS